MDLFTKRDFDMLQYQRELMRKASLTSPPITLSGNDITLVRRFAQESFAQMRSIYPEVFKDKTIDDWEKSIRLYLASRRPEFREEMLVQLRKRYGDKPEPGERATEPSKVLASQAVEELQRKVAEVQADVMVELLDKEAKKEDKGPTFPGTVARGALYGTLGGALVGAPSSHRAYRAFRRLGVPGRRAALSALKILAGHSAGPGIAGTIGAMTAYPFMRKEHEWRKKKEQEKGKK